MADEERNNVQPDANTGDVINAMRAEQASLGAMYQLQQIQNQSLESLRKLQEFTNSELRKQTNILQNLYNYVVNQLSSQGAAAQTRQTSQSNYNSRPSRGFDAEASVFANQFVSRMDDTYSLINELLSHNDRANSTVSDLLEGLRQEFSEGTSDRVIAAESGLTDALEIGGLLQSLNQTPGSAQGIVNTGGDVLAREAGDIVGNMAGDVIGTLVPELGPFSDIIGNIIGDKIERTLGAGFDAVGEWLGELESIGRKSRDKIIENSFEKIRRDVQAMSTYAIDVYKDSTNQIYQSWDKNIGDITATMGYTKEAVNTLQDAVAQRLQNLGYENVINAGDYLEELNKVLSANLNSTVAEVFASQSLILEKAVPEIDLSSLAAEFAAIYTNAQRETGAGEEAMVAAMNQVAGAVKAIEQTTEGNNQFIKEVPAYLRQAQELVARAGGSVDNVAALTTQMMAAEGPLASLAPQLSGFTGELVSVLTKQNDASAVALRAIMHDINSNIGISATDFMSSFMEDTQDTLVTAFQALDEFIARNENPAARQEFLAAMENLFGIQSDKLAQLDFRYISEQLAQTNANMNTAALLDAERLVREGETTTLEEQLVANTSNMLLSSNAIRDTLDNAIMRKLEANELWLEEQVRITEAVQAVNFAEDTMQFFVKLKDIVVDLLDPLGLFKDFNNLISVTTSGVLDAANYAMVANWSSIGSNVADDMAATANTFKNTVGGATAAIAAATASDGNAAAVDLAMEAASVAGSTLDLYGRHISARMDDNEAAMAALVAQSEQTVGNYKNTVEEQQRREEQRAREEAEQTARQQAAEANQRRQEEKDQRELDNYENIRLLSVETVPGIDTAIRGQTEMVGVSLSTINDTIITKSDEFTATYVENNTTSATKIQELHDDGVQTVVAAIRDNKPDVSKLETIDASVDKLVTFFATYLEYIDQSLAHSKSGGLHMSSSDRAQITGRGLLY